MNPRIITRAALWLCGCIAAVTGSRADLVAFSFSGSVDFSFATVTLPGGPILSGDAINGTLVYDSLAPDQAPGDPSTGVYSLTDISFTIGGNTFTLSTPPGATLTIEDGVLGFDAMTADATVTDGVRDITATLRYEDPTASVLSSDALPLTPPAFGPGTLFLEFFGTEGELILEGTLDAPPVIPAPSAAWLGAAGIAALGCCRRWIR